MLKHYIKFAIRNFRSNKVIFAGGLATLCLGTLCISLLFAYVHNELSMDNFHKREKDIYTVIVKDSPNSGWSAISPSYFFDFDYKNFPEIEEVVSVIKIRKKDATVFYKNSSFLPEGIITNNNFFKIFDFKLKGVDSKTLTNDPNAVLLSEQFVKKVFGDQNPIGELIKIRTNNEENTYTVNGIVKLPANSSIIFDFILLRPEKKREKGGFGGTDILLVNKTTDINLLKTKIEDIGKGQALFGFKKIAIVALDDVYFEKDIPFSAIIFSRFGDKKNIYVLVVIMLVILIISALNFSNLQIINTNVSIKQSAINMVNGAQKYQIVYQKTVELLLLFVLIVAIVTIGYQYCSPVFNNFVHVEIWLPLWKVLLINGTILVLLIMLALSYPLIVVLRISIIKSLKNGFLLGNQLRGQKAILFFQYALTFILLISSITVSRQLKLMLDKDLGFTYKNIIRTKLYYPPLNWHNQHDGERVNEIKELNEKHQYMNNELQSYSSIINFSQGYSPLKPRAFPCKGKGMEEDFALQNWLNVTPGYEKVYSLKIIEGRFFDIQKDNLNSKNRKIVINEAAKKYWKISDIAKHRILTHWDSEVGFEIIGVVKDFNYERLSVKPKPLVLSYNEDLEYDFFIEFQEGKIQEGLQFVEALFNNVNSGQAFSYSFLSDEIAALYQKEKRLSTIYMVFTIIALLISAIGLFTIALYDTQRRIKEIGIRKVNGATINEIMFILNKDFIKWVLIAFIIACPISYYVMSKWLENFAYKTSLSWWVFALAGVFTLVIALLTVSWQSFRAATRNPVESLRDE